MTDSKTNKGTALVTGASAGIGKGYARRLAERGYDLILVARRGDRLKEISQQLSKDHGVKVDAIVADLGSATDVHTVVERIASDEKITLVVNNAGVSTFGQVATTDVSVLNAMTHLNVTALVEISRAALAAFKPRNIGTLVNVGSVLSFHTLPVSSAYSGSKGYVMNFTRGLQEEVNGTNVFVQLVLPASTATELWDIAGIPLSTLDPEKVMSTEDLVDAALSGLDQKERITLPSVEDQQLFIEYDNARLKLLAASQTKNAASRYKVGKRN